MNTGIAEAAIDAFIRKTVKEILPHIRKVYDTPNFSPAVRVSFAPNRRCSRGGIRRGLPFISIVGKRFVKPAMVDGYMDEPEYKRFDNDPVIGGMKNVPWRKALAGLVAHELAHAVQFYQGTRSGAKRVLGIEELEDYNDLLSGHDWFWKKIYADLRVQFVNSANFDSNASKAPVQAPVQAPVAAPVAAPVEVKPTSGVLFVKYMYKGNATHSIYYIDQKLAGVIAEINRKFYRADVFGEVFEQIEAKYLAEARRILIGQ